MSELAERQKVKCSRCRNVHYHDERLKRPDPSYPGMAVYDLVCPRCKGKLFYELDKE